MPKSKTNPSSSLVTVTAPSTDFSAELKKSSSFTTIKVTSDPKLEVARTNLTTVKAFLKKIDSTFDPIIKAINKAAKEARSQKATAAAPFESTKLYLDTQIKSYLAKKELETSLKLEAERARLEQLTSQVSDDDDNEIEPETLKELTKLSKDINALESKQSDRTTNSYKRYSATVTSLQDLVAAVASGTVPLEALLANTVYLNAQATALKDQYSIPGTTLEIKTVLVG